MDEINLDFASSDLPKLPEMPKWKKLAIIGGVIGAFVIFIIIIVILIASSSGTKSREVIGQIVCNYEDFKAGEPTQIFGNNFKSQDSIEMSIESKKLKFTKQYEFKETDKGEIKIDVYDDIDMDYMFNDVKNLASIVLYSSKGAKIKSMISTFENCESLRSFTNSGFDTSQVKSMRNLFHGSKLPALNLAGNCYYNMFQGCTLLIKAPKGIVSKT